MAILLETGSYLAVLKRPTLTVPSSTATKKIYFCKLIFNFPVGVAIQMPVMKIISRATRATAVTTPSDLAMTARAVLGQFSKGKSNTTTYLPSKSSEANPLPSFKTSQTSSQAYTKQTASRP